MKKILILSELKIFPSQNEVQLRSGRVAKSLARMGHEVCIHSIADRSADYALAQAVLYQGIEENLVEEVNRSRWGSVVFAISRRLGWIPGSLQKRLRWADIIICDLPYNPPIPGDLRGKTWLRLNHAQKKGGIDFPLQESLDSTPLH
ncbi:MAG: hypothetical protein EOP10_14900 [Proteobacteria bacterium]|nr:MAG: hypothetical protein EOP10_14900 [Pseudomonadota bacterium]